jgi:hypothetical protein
LSYIDVTFRSGFGDDPQSLLKKASGFFSYRSKIICETPRIKVLPLPEKTGGSWESRVKTNSRSGRKNSNENAKPKKKWTGAKVKSLLRRKSLRAISRILSLKPIRLEQSHILLG